MTYGYRTITCPDCSDGNTCRAYVTSICETCDGHVEIDASCTECSVITAISEAGLCERCTDMSELSIADFNEKYQLTEVTKRDLGDDWHRVAA